MTAVIPTYSTSSEPEGHPQPLFTNADMQELHDWLTEQGFTYNGPGHDKVHTYTWPKTGEYLRVERKPYWKKTSRNKALKIMGVARAKPTKTKKRQAVERNSYTAEQEAEIARRDHAAEDRRFRRHLEDELGEVDDALRHALKAESDAKRPIDRQRATAYIQTLQRQKTRVMRTLSALNDGRLTRAA